VAGVQLTGGSITGSGTLTSAAAFDLQAGGVSAILGGSAGANKTTAGTVTLSGVNTYTGLTTVSAGTLAYGASNVISSGAVTVSGSTAILSLGAFIDSVGIVTVSNGGSITGTGTLTSSGTFEMQSGSVSAILGGPGIALNKTTSGTVTLSGANTYTGVNTISTGVLSVATIGNGGVAGNLGQASNAAANLILSGGTLQYTGATASTDRNFTLSTGTTSTIDIATNSLTVSGASTSTTGGLTKTGAGTLDLAGNNLHTGTTTVSGGKLTVSSTGLVNFTVGVTIGAGEFNYNSATALSKPITFNLTGGSLSGIGTITPSVTLSSGNTYSAGAIGDPGTQAFTGGLALASGSIFSWDLDATTSDPGANSANAGSYDIVTGNGSGTGTFKVVLGLNHFSDVFWNTNKSWNNIFSGNDPSFTLFSGTDGVSSVASNGAVTGEGQFTYTGSTLSWTPVPEPSSALAGILLATGLLRRKRAQELCA